MQCLKKLILPSLPSFHQICYQQSTKYFCLLYNLHIIHQLLSNLLILNVGHGLPTKISVCSNVFVPVPGCNFCTNFYIFLRAIKMPLTQLGPLFLVVISTSKFRALVLLGLPTCWYRETRQGSFSRWEYSLAGNYSKVLISQTEILIHIVFNLSDICVGADFIVFWEVSPSAPRERNTVRTLPCSEIPLEFGIRCRTVQEIQCQIKSFAVGRYLTVYTKTMQFNTDVKHNTDNETRRTHRWSIVLPLKLSQALAIVSGPQNQLNWCFINQSHMNKFSDNCDQGSIFGLPILID